MDPRLERAIEFRRWQTGTPGPVVFNVGEGPFSPPEPTPMLIPDLDATPVPAWATPDAVIVCKLAPLEGPPSVVRVLETSPLMCLVEREDGHTGCLETWMLATLWGPRE